MLGDVAVNTLPLRGSPFEDGNLLGGFVGEAIKFARITSRVCSGCD